MFETLFKRPTVLARYRDDPLAEARERFIEQCAARGYSHAMLRKIAWVLLALARGIDIDHGKMTARDIERAVERRTRFKHSPEPVQDSLGSRRLFVHIATEWVRSLGCLEPTPAVECPFAAQIAAFARHLRDERGLSPVTILDAL